MRNGNGQLVAAIASAAVGSVVLIWLLIGLAFPNTGPADLQAGQPSAAANRALLQQTLDRFDGLARNMSLRITAAEQALKALQKSGPARASARAVVATATAPFAAAHAPPEAEDVAEFSVGEPDGDNDPPEESDEERAKRLAAEEKEQNDMIGYDPVAKTFKRRFRPDYKCGDRVPPLPDMQPVECEPAGVMPCCSSLGWCGKSKLHCSCETCEDYQSKVKLSVKAISVAQQGRECGDIAYSFGEQASPRACAEKVLPQVECGRTLMFSHQYPDWGCRCCSAGSEPSDEAAALWTLYKLEVAAEDVE